MKHPTYKDLRAAIDAPTIHWHPDGGSYVLVDRKYLGADGVLHDRCEDVCRFDVRVNAVEAAAKWEKSHEH